MHDVHIPPVPDNTDSKMFPSTYRFCGALGLLYSSGLSSTHVAKIEENSTSHAGHISACVTRFF